MSIYVMYTTTTTIAHEFSVFDKNYCLVQEKKFAFQLLSTYSVSSELAIFTLLDISIIEMNGYVLLNCI